ncbi:MAG: TOBE domain-containing protein [Cyclobacteriaceae bacterium]|nr:TOBE domain-containing protein [Cyclobacteriaceae bacterium]
MNKIPGKITEVNVEGNISLLTIRSGEVFFKAIVLEVPETSDYLKVGNPIHILFKETEVIIGKGDVSQISLRNKINCEVVSIDNGKLLSKLTLHSDLGEIRSVITSNAVSQLQIREGDKVVAMIKTNEIILSE